MLPNFYGRTDESNDKRPKDSQYTDGGSNHVPPEYEARITITEL
jgi:hypothetical protein